MLGKNIISREHFIADILTDPLKPFHTLEFETFKTFVSVLAKELVFTKKRLRIRVKSNDELIYLGKILNETAITHENKIDILMTSALFKEVLAKELSDITEIPHTVFIDDADFNIFTLLKDEANRKWITTHASYVERNITYENYVHELAEIPHTYMQKGIRFFNLHWDYQSFEKMPLEELHKLEFWINHVISWRFRKAEDKNELVFYFNTNFDKPLFISENLCYYFNRNHFIANPTDYLIDMTQKHETYRQIVKFTKYAHLLGNQIYVNWLPSRLNWNMVDFYQNELIMGNVNEFPEITLLVLRWFGRAY